MEVHDSKGKIIKQTFPSEIISIIGDIFAGIILLVLILPFKSFLLLIILIPALLSLRGNITGPFIARTSRDIIVGGFNKRSWIENVAATLTLGFITSFLIGLLCVLLNVFLIRLSIIPITIIILIPIMSSLLTLFFTIPFSTLLNYLTFKFGFNPNNIVNPVMTAVGDLTAVICFFITLITLGVP